MYDFKSLKAENIYEVLSTPNGFSYKLKVWVGKKSLYITVTAQQRVIKIIYNMKYLKSFNESSKSGKMNKKHRRNILREANRRMKKKYSDFDDLQSGQFEKTQDEFIDSVFIF